MRKLLLLLTVASVSISFCWAQAPQKKTETKVASKAPAAKKPVLRTLADNKWQDVPDVKGVQQAVLWGDPQKGAYGELVKFAPGTEAPLHTHTADARSVVVSGTVLVGLEGAKPREFGPGSYIFTPSGLKHTTGCKTGSDCIFFLYQPGAFDLKPVEGGAK